MVSTRLGSFWLALAVAPPAIGLLGAAVERWLLRPLRARYPLSHLLPLLLTFGLSLFFEGSAKVLWGADIVSLDKPAPRWAAPLALGRVTFPTYWLFALVAAAVLAAGVWLVVERTSLGLVDPGRHPGSDDGRRARRQRAAAQHDRVRARLGAGRGGRGDPRRDDEPLAADGRGHRARRLHRHRHRRARQLHRGHRRLAPARPGPVLRRGPAARLPHPARVPGHGGGAGAAAERPLRRGGAPMTRWPAVVIGVALALAPLGVGRLYSAYYLNLLTWILIFALFAAGLDLALGFGGLVSFGHAGFFGIGRLRSRAGPPPRGVLALDRARGGDRGGRAPGGGGRLLRGPLARRVHGDAHLRLRPAPLRGGDQVGGGHRRQRRPAGRGPAARRVGRPRARPLGQAAHVLAGARLRGAGVRAGPAHRGLALRAGPDRAAGERGAGARDRHRRHPAPARGAGVLGGAGRAGRRPLRDLPELRVPRAALLRALGRGGGDRAAGRPGHPLRLAGGGRHRHRSPRDPVHLHRQLAGRSSARSTWPA